MKTTQLEYQVLEAILTSDHQDHDNPIGHPVWYLDENDVDMKPGQLAGAISSCVKKGFVGIDKSVRGEETIWITAEGMLAYDEYNNSIEMISGNEVSEALGMVSNMLDEVEKYSHVEDVIQKFDWLHKPIEQLREAFAKLDVEMQRRQDLDIEQRD